MLRIIGVPVDSSGAESPGSASFGTEQAPAVLRAAGLVEVLDAVDAGDVTGRIHRSDRDPQTGVLGWSDVEHLTESVRAAVVDTLHAGDLPIVVGGCGSLLPGALAGARDALGVVSLAYAAGHLGLCDGTSSPTGQAADMALAVILGVGPEAWVEQISAPLVPADGVAILGARDRAAARANGSILPEDLGHSSEFDPDTLRDLGMERAGRDTERALTTVAEGFWLHLDVDVMTTQDMPAIDKAQDGGLEAAELSELLAPLGGSEGLVGVSVVGYNPGPNAPDSSVSDHVVSLLRTLLRE